MEENEDRLGQFLKWIALGVGAVAVMIAISVAFSGCTVINPVCFGGCSASRYKGSGFILSKDRGIRRPLTTGQTRRL